MSNEKEVICLKTRQFIHCYNHRTNDDDDKLIIVPENKEYSDDAINALVEFQEQYFKHVIVR